MRQGDLVITADFGTSAVKVGAVDGDLTLLSKATEDYPLNLAPGGIAEQNPADLWAALARGLTQLRHDIPDLKDRATTLVFSSQICGLICADETGRALMPCMTWLDKRAAKVGQALIGGFPTLHGYQVGKLLRWLRIANGAPAKNGMDPIAKMLWVAKHAPEIHAQTRWFLDVKDWLVHRATGRFTTCAESANVTWLLDSRKGQEGWSKTLAKMAGIPFEKLPEIVDASEIVETLTAQAAGELGLSKDTIVLGGTSDVTAAALGSGEVEDGALHVCAATSSWISGFMGKRLLNVPNSYATISSGLNYRPLLVVSQENAGSAMEWAVRVSGGQTEGESLAQAFDDMGAPMSDDPFFVPWLAGERVPLDNDLVRGAFHGLALHHDPRAMRRAALEGVALNLRWAYSILTREKGIQMDGPLSMVGGVAANPHFAQTVADALNRDVRVGEARHAGVLGTATLAAKVQGWAADPFEAAARLRTHTTAHYSPNPERVGALAERNTRLEKIRRDLIRSYRP